MRHIRLVAVEDEYDSPLGLVVKGTIMSEGMAADRDGTLLAHDILEHQNGMAAIGPVDDEIQALGGVWQVRGRHGHMLTGRRLYHSPQYSVASDLVGMLRDLDGSTWWPGSGNYRTHTHYHDEDFHEIIDMAMEDISKEFDDECIRALPCGDYFHDALHLLRIGFNKAQRRFGHGYAGADLFVAIRDARQQAHPGFVGQEFRLSYGNGRASITELYQEDY